MLLLSAIHVGRVWVLFGSLNNLFSFINYLHQVHLLVLQRHQFVVLSWKPHIIDLVDSSRYQQVYRQVQDWHGTILLGKSLRMSNSTRSIFHRWYSNQQVPNLRSNQLLFRKLRQPSIFSNSRTNILSSRFLAIHALHQMLEVLGQQKEHRNQPMSVWLLSNRPLPTLLMMSLMQPYRWEESASVILRFDFVVYLSLCFFWVLVPQ